jgi:hypothetical protein
VFTCQSEDLRRVLRAITPDDLDGGFAIQHPHRIAGLVGQMLESEQYRYVFDALFDNLLLFSSDTYDFVILFAFVVVVVVFIVVVLAVVLVIIILF